MTVNTVRTEGIPAPVQVARALLGAVAVAHLVVPIALWSRQDSLRQQIAAQHPEFATTRVSSTVHVTVISAAVFHGVFLLVCVLLARKLKTGRRWTRTLTTVSQALSIAFSFFSWSSSPMFHAVIPIMDAAQVVLICLLWVPRPARRFFSQHALPNPAVRGAGMA